MASEAISEIFLRDVSPELPNCCTLTHTTLTYPPPPLPIWSTTGTIWWASFFLALFPSFCTIQYFACSMQKAKETKTYEILLYECLAEGRSLPKQHSLQIFCPEQQAIHFCFTTFRACTLGQSIQEKSWRSFGPLPLLCLPRYTLTMW